MTYNEFVKTIAKFMDLSVSYNGNDIGIGGVRHWICGHFGDDFHAESAFNNVAIISWTKCVGPDGQDWPIEDAEFAVVENNGEAGQHIHRIGTLRQCINTARSLYRNQ